MADIKVLDNIVALNLDINVWSARRKMTPHDLGATNLPPADLASLGSKRIADPAKINAFLALRSKAYRYLDSVGLKFLGGWAIPEAKADEVVAELQRQKDQFETEKRNFLASYDEGVKAWIDQHPEWSEMIKNSIVGADYVCAKLHFGWQMFKVSPPKTAKTLESFDDAVNGLAETLFGDAAKAAKDVWEQHFKGQTRVSHRKLSPIRTIHAKLRSMAFIDPVVSPAANIVWGALNEADKFRGAMWGNTLVMVQGVLNLLMNPQNLFAHCNALIGGAGVHDVLVDIISDNLRKRAEEAKTADASPQETNEPEETKTLEENGAANEEAEEEEEEEVVDTSIGIPSYGLW